jgi:hypothetical protein
MSEMTKNLKNLIQRNRNPGIMFDKDGIRGYLKSKEKKQKRIVEVLVVQDLKKLETDFFNIPPGRGGIWSWEEAEKEERK